MEKQVRVGAAVIIKRGNTILLGKRTGSHGAETWALPGGHLEYGEKPEETCLRETEEETGLKIGNLKKFYFTNDIFTGEEKHYITIYYTADYISGNAERKEPHKCLEWRWCNKEELPSPLFLPLVNLIKDRGAAALFQGK